MTTCPEKDERAGSAKRAKLKQGYDDGLFREGSGTLADVDEDGELVDDDDDFDDDWDDEDEDWDPDHQLDRALAGRPRSPSGSRAQVSSGGDPAPSGSIS